MGSAKEMERRVLKHAYRSGYILDRVEVVDSLCPGLLVNCTKVSVGKGDRFLES